ncbi:hypothetical protein B0I35DRAFT_170160 [Stachybotrys elegans]|uniref:Uncharacterized protein n=1 Tax=Stachybotrys elegans TaxID=80388 RepID=A0A8K0WU10_9HYPO|nr:hypothetical protein B0I35DRAFT_170160 [Stachybotrys elegans]
MLYKGAVTLSSFVVLWFKPDSGYEIHASEQWNRGRRRKENTTKTLSGAPERTFANSHRPTASPTHGRHGFRRCNFTRNRHGPRQLAALCVSAGDDTHRTGYGMLGIENPSSSPQRGFALLNKANELEHEITAMLCLGVEFS